MAGAVKARLLLSLAAAVAAPTVVSAQQPSFDCANPLPGTVEPQVCASRLLSGLDAELHRLYAATPVATGADYAQRLSDQSAWLAGRDACRTQPSPETCVRNAYLSRIAVLRAGSATARAHGSISMGPVVYRCAGIEGDVVATFVQTTPPLVHLRNRERASVLQHTPSADGRQYRDETVGTTFSVTGQTARYRPDNTRSEAQCTAPPGG